MNSRLTPACVLTVFEAASLKINHFSNGTFLENMDWIEEIQAAAKKAFGSTSITLLPKTPSMKRKRPNIKKANESESVSPDKHASTFVDGCKTKKLKIDMSAIVENGVIAEDSVLEESNASTLKYPLRSKPSKKKKTSTQPVKRSKRLAAKSSCNSFIESPMDLESNSTRLSPKKSRTVVIEDTPSPGEGTMMYNKSAFVASQNTIISPTSNTVISPVPHNVQPRVAAIIEQLKLTAQKSNKKEISPKSPLEVMDEVRMELFVNESEGKACLLPDSKVEQSADQSSSMTAVKKCSVSIEPLPPAMLLDASDNIYSSPSIAPRSLTATPTETVPLASVVVSKNQSTPNISVNGPGQSTPVSTYSSPMMNTPVGVKTTEELLENKKFSNTTGAGVILEREKSEKLFTKVQSKTSDQDSGVSSSDEQTQPGTGVSADGSDDFKMSKERRETYKVTVTEKELPQKSTPQRIETNVIAAKEDYVNTESKYNTVEEHTRVDLVESDKGIEAQEIHKGPRIIKPMKGGNIVVGLKSFIKRQDTPKKETEEEKQMKKAAELERKELLRQKVMEEAHLKKQKMLDQRKRQREEREKRFAEQQARRQQEEERKRQQLEIKARQMSKKREEITKQREIEEKRKREIREAKRADADARRMKDEEGQKRRVLEQVEEEKRRQELLQRKAEYEDQERLRRKLEHEKAERERLKHVEEDRILYEGRKKREFAEKELHRLEVERKLKEDREKERLEKQKREERLKQAESEIEAARKLEQERERAKDKLREEIKKQIHQDKQVKGGQFNGKVLVNAQNALRSSPRTALKNNFKPPSVNALSVKSPAAYNVKKALSSYNPPCVPLMIRESTYTSYGIDDLSSDDSTDDECEPSKRIPAWAQGMNLKTQLMQQFYTNIDPGLIFINCMEPCRLDKIFQKKKERYFKRTSSAHWTSPILKNSSYQVK